MAGGAPTELGSTSRRSCPGVARETVERIAFCVAWHVPPDAAAPGDDARAGGAQGCRRARSRAPGPVNRRAARGPDVRYLAHAPRQGARHARRAALHTIAGDPHGRSVARGSWGRGGAGDLALSGTPDPAEIMAEPLRALLSPGVLEHPYGSAGWKRWLRQTLANRFRAVTRPGESGLDCVPELTAICLGNPDFVPITPATVGPPRSDWLTRCWRAGTADRASPSSTPRPEAFPAEARGAGRVAHPRPVVRGLQGVPACLPGSTRHGTWPSTASAPGCGGARTRGTARRASLDPFLFWTPFSLYAWRFGRYDRGDRVSGGRLLLAQVEASRIVSVGGSGHRAAPRGRSHP